MWAQVAIVYGPPAPLVADGWVCPACRHENQMHYLFCLGCGACRPERLEPVKRAYGAGKPTNARQRSPVVLIVLVVALIIGGAIAGVAAMLMAR
jgi:hypothetical protein